MKRRQVRSKEAKAIFRRFLEGYPWVPPESLKGQLEEVAVSEDTTLYLVQGRPLVLSKGSDMFPTLLFEEAVAPLPKVIVDMGAIPHITNGADVMAPGVKGIKGSFAAGSLVAVVDEKFMKTIALGLALADSNTLAARGKGKAVKNVHYVGDKVWKVALEARAGSP